MQTKDRFYPIRKPAPIDFYDPRSAKIIKLNREAQLSLYECLLLKITARQSLECSTASSYLR